MKKNFLLGAFFCFGLTMIISADNPPTIFPKGLEHHIATLESHALKAKENARYRLDSRIAKNEVEVNRFYYDAQNRLICSTITSDLDTKDSLFYDENNNLLRFDGYQNLGTKWMHAYYVEYTYDTNGNILSRTNYNNTSQNGEPNWNLGGIYKYTYNQNKQLVSHEMYLGSADFLYETCNYTYNDAGQLVEQLSKIDNWGNGFINSNKIEYFYDNSNRLYQIENYYYDNDEWVLSNIKEYVFDSVGNCSEINAKDGDGNYIDRHIYEFNSKIPYSQLLLPTDHIELGVTEFLDGDIYQRTLEHWYTMDMEKGQLVYVFDYNYNYSETDNIQNYTSESNVKVYPNPTTDLVHFDADAFQTPVKQVSVWDMQGRQIKVKTHNQGSYTVDFNGLQSGMYILRVECVDGSSYLCKVVKK